MTFIYLLQSEIIKDHMLAVLHKIHYNDYGNEEWKQMISAAGYFFIHIPLNPSLSLFVSGFCFLGTDVCET